MEATADSLPWAAQCAGAALFAAALCVTALGVVLVFLRRWPWCSCHVCRAYLTGSWARDFTNLGDWYAHLLRESPTGTIHVHVLGCTVTANPANVEYMLRTNFDNFPKGKAFAALLGDLLGGGIFNVDGHAWRHQRKMASLELGSVAVRSYAFGIVAQEVESRLVPVLAAAADAGAVVDLQDVFRRFAFDTICKISFGLDPGCLEREMPVSRLADAFDVATRLCAMRGAAASPLVWRAKRLLNVGSERELREAIALVDELAAAVIRERRKLGVAGSHDLLSRFMASAGAGDGDDKYLRDIVVSFLLAGRDTVSSALTTLFMLLSKNPGVAAAMRAEAGDGESAAPLTYEHLKGLHYTHAVLYENMRLFPPVQFDSKFCAGPDVLPDGTYVAGGTRVTYHPYAMGRMPRIWGADHGAFRPDRWLTGAGASFVPESLYRYPVFQAGLRVCLGKELAVTEMKVVAVAVVRAFDVEVVGDSGATACAPKFVSGLTASISGGLPVRVRRRVVR
ncbi:cytochrome P450 94C1-like [Zea mays]|jgi:12-hydroxyjasmonoyl-L-amino acid 12-hydroxylase / fatty acid hydroxylase|uniref:Cytochrome P450 CYP94C20 n=1 Tax=Zea mays TaxID=4577 RepID=B6STM6_MAIZE|nr:cytochrome P450 94C1-like [Zea mays]ACG28209.1 cytochrome P450 CYP94C20 [Zea mays]|eukprot:NP_001306672.1 cytochrome P450 94C1-like [Zea mays]